MKSAEETLIYECARAFASVYWYGGEDVVDLEATGVIKSMAAALAVARPAILEAAAKVCDQQIEASRYLGEPSGLAELCRNGIRKLAQGGGGVGGE